MKNKIKNKETVKTHGMALMVRCLKFRIQKHIIV